jgi:hypothetical protein
MFFLRGKFAGLLPFSIFLPTFEFCNLLVPKLARKIEREKELLFQWPAGEFLSPSEIKIVTCYFTEYF